MADVGPVRELGEVALIAARAGADAIRRVVGTGHLDTQVKSAGHDLVTAADRASEQAILGVLRTARPDDTIVGEEGGAYQGTSSVRWLVDPLDGTANFVYGRADFAVSVGAECDGRPVAGAILRPADGVWLVTADRGVYVGRESSPDSTAVRDLRHVPLADSLITVGLPYSLTARQDVLTVVAQLAPVVRGVRVVGSAAGDLAALTLGQCDGFIGFGLAEWDTAAGRALVIKAGGAVREIDSPSSLRVLLAAGSSMSVNALTEHVDNAIWQSVG